ncbi:winged helix-turn-helix domain-containing protein [Nocardia cyriacigeorgica]|uniref:BTAD domain-containing putative transcriptional regulator n=1 Tax=Nocardia cyriacigeorgica TaxID=135487 RepID=UPI0018960AB9|nr:BTAD domain-containing putative transcriptional regulator [Nocardia cyriacigeorgica]MBF6321556.1 winged helix-turn-helix domain-containing protein [Nocardia cyriacigeorgica]MBF6494766.1 winged helix-turn-helix domain-containing protein [Nocardia cyriacigeorgica]
MQIKMLGPLEIRTDDGGLIAIPGARLRALLIALALEPGRAVSKTKLIDWIWGEQPPADAANALQALVSRLRRVLPEGAIDVQAGGYRLTVEPGAVDAVRFDQLLDRARGGDDAHQARLLREAVELWRGAAMQDLGDSDDVAAVVTRYDGLRLSAMEDLYEAEIRLGRGAELVTELTDLVAQHPVRERLAGSLMRALAAAGRGPEALTVFQRTREALADELGVDPSPELSALHVALLRGEVGARPQERTTNLRAELTSYVGKLTDIAAVRELIAAHRLTTVTGPGGSGKTRLAVETARTMLGDLPDGAWLVELAGVDGSGDLAQAALAAFGLRDALLGSAPNAEPMERLVAAIRDRETLLILDNCEHVIEAAAAFAHRVLGECTRLRILATSREPLGITGEALWQVEPLALPAATAEAAVIADSPAVALLRDRASAVRQDLGTDPATLATMARICRALDGIPLAIELAAARLRTMSLDQLAHRLDDRFRLLTGGSRTAIRQHRTLRAVVDWSWELLTDAERLVLARLAVFAGVASLEAAEQVCADGSTVEQWQVLELLTSLTEKSLLVPTDDGLRFRMLETIKQYAADRLAESGDAEAARRAHLTYFTGLAATAEPHLRRAEQLEWLAVLEAEHDNIAAAMRGALASEDAPAAMALAAAAGWYWWLGGHKGEGTELVIAAAELPGEVDDETRAMAYGLVVHFVSSGRNDEQQIAEWIRKAHRFGREVDGGHPALRFTAALDRMLQGPDEYLPAFESLLDDEEPWVRALARLQLGKLRTVLGHQGQEADDYLAQALTEFRALGERWGMSFALTELANRTAQRGELLRAVELFDEAIAVVTEVGALEDVVAMRARQALLHWVLGDPDASAAALAEAQRCADQNGWPTALAEVALARAELARLGDDRALAYQQIDLARTLLGADAEQPNVGATVHILLAYLTDDLTEAATHCDAAYRAAAAAGHALLTAHVLIGIADLAVRKDHYEQATRLLAAASTVRGLPDHSHPDAARIEQKTRNHLGDKVFDQATGEGAKADPHELVAQALGH